MSLQARDVLRGVVRLPPRAEDLTDLGNARRFATEHGSHLGYDHITTTWLAYDGTRWAADTTGEADRAAVSTVEGMLAETSQQREEDRQRWGAHAVKSMRVTSLAAMLRLTQSMLPMDASTLDADDMVLNLTNGTLDLATRKLRKHAPEDYCGRIGGTHWDPTAKAPIFHAFLERAQPDPEMRAYLQRLSGYALTGSTREQIFTVFLGGGQEGKSKLTTVLAQVLGGYAMPLPVEVLMGRDGGDTRSLLALRGARLALLSENESTVNLGVAMLKRLTGEDPIGVRPMRSNSVVTFTPAAKFVLGTNHLPKINDSSYGTWRRMRVVEFNVRIPDHEVDQQLGDKLAEEHAGILRWAVEGCAAWQRDGLKPPAGVLAATDTYRLDSDDLGRFIEERCLLGPNWTVAASELWSAWTDWATEQHVPITNSTAFGREMSRRSGITKQKKGLVRYSGITVQS